MVAGQNGDHREPEEAVLQPTQGQGRLCAFEEVDLKPENVAAIATCLGVNSEDVIDMNAVWAVTLRSTRCCVKRAKTVENGKTGSSTAVWTRNASS